MSELLAFASQATVAVVGDGKVEIPWGAWVADAVPWLAAGVGGVGAWLLRFVPAHLRWMFQVAQVDQLIDKAIQYGVNKIPGVHRDSVLTIEVSNKVVEYAVEYALAHAPKIVAQFVGPLSILKQKILARLNVE